MIDHEHLQRRDPHRRAAEGGQVTLDEIEKLAREFVEAPNAGCARTFKAFDERDDPMLARAVLRLLPVVRAAEAYSERRRANMDRQTPQSIVAVMRAMDDIERAVDEMRRGLEDSNGQP
jgi:hypothetical protein